MRTILVLNSNALREKAVAAIRGCGAARVELYLDHDPSGRTLTAYLRQELGGIEVIDRADCYAGSKDVNEFLIAQTQTAN